MPGYTVIDSLFQTPLPPIQRGIQRYNGSFTQTEKNKKIWIWIKNTVEEKKNLDQCAMLQMTSSHNTNWDGDMENRLQPGEEVGDTAV